MGAERSFAKEIEQLRLSAGEIFRGEGILAVTKALLQSGVAYVGGYQGAPVSHLLDVMVDGEELMSELGIHVETCTNEAAAAAMLGASINYPLRGAVTWKSIVGTNVAADGLSNLSSPGVMGGVLIISGEDYGEGASVIQERTHAMAMKSSMWLLDPRPELTNIVKMVEHGFALSEASNTPVIMGLRVRTCHMQGEFVSANNAKPAISIKNKMAEPAKFNYDHLAHPPVTFAQEKIKISERLPAAQKYITTNNLNEVIEGDISNLGIIMQGGLYNTLIRRLSAMGLADAFGKSRIPLLVLNVVHPLAPEQINNFCRSKEHVLVLEEGNPEFIEYQINSILRERGTKTRLAGKSVMPNAGEYTAENISDGLYQFLLDCKIDIELPLNPVHVRAREDGLAALGAPLPPRPPQMCTGCPERPVFSALKILEREVGKVHIAADIGCHALATFEPFSMGNSILGYGMSLASAAAVAPFQEKRSISIMGDGGFWHNGLATGVIGNLLNQGDAILIIMQNGYTSATGQQFIPNSAAGWHGDPLKISIEKTLKALGVDWLKVQRTYDVADMINVLRDALTTKQKGLKVIIADGECQLARQRKLRGEDAKKLAAGKRVAKIRFGIDPAICSGDHACIRLSGCPSLTLMPNPDPLSVHPISTVIDSCVGCGLCGEAAMAAGLCPSFYSIERITNPNPVETAINNVRHFAKNIIFRGGRA
ncbi:MAG: indolepyruvate ferredoxin oxidoreductase subunit alpha [Rhodospirillaceae bacterium]|nr:indolepyruvate ferredoxin oxidoreductase subunit alpha [Rhodospirillaceae bacterium]